VKPCIGKDSGPGIEDFYLQDRQERGAAGGGDGFEQVAQGRVTALERQHVLELVEAAAAIDAVPVAQGIERVEEFAEGDGAAARHGRRLAEIQLVEDADAGGVEREIREVERHTQLA
jgi:hypothetical protein